jgi:cytochrome P450/NADPH-cytochrome P450 reductase
MAPAVRGELLALHQRRTGSTPDQAEQWLRSLEASGRYQQDVFA